MNSSDKAFLKNEGRFGRPLEPKLALFGKHSAWLDHMEGFGVVTPSLSFLKKILYIEGIGGNVGRSCWSGLEKEGKLLSYGHDFLWQKGKRCLIGSLIGSSDGKGRSEFPLVAVLETAVPENAGQLEETLLSLNVFLDEIMHEHSQDEVLQLWQLYASRFAGGSLGSSEKDSTPCKEMMIFLNDLSHQAWERTPTNCSNSKKTISLCCDYAKTLRRSQAVLFISAHQQKYVDVFFNLPSPQELSVFRSSEA